MTTQQMLDDRYGRTRSPHARAWAWTIGVVVAVIVGALLIWMAWGSTSSSVDATATGYEVVDARTVTVSFQVTSAHDSGVVCVLEADDEDHGIVGWKVVHLPASDQHTNAYRETIPTIGVATTGLVNACWVE
ncbi:DUF4307 domain-containing protein [Microbacterium horticulturae]|uniref:DUF4307 domain-containing protein n=1 Tax=Microbacterium horticulturae TaxID=3028316 RepID=A0ABY8BYU4_9MICO|nr:DUF4307 domain-containing protein [Microbacterium sp. KACC 23027]WEG07593.1 DUF4307 domain-containing protein [Microbacterium sp. KACC 23027]